ncbi:MAG: SBBP repeat-containing protein [Chitinophagaceae bacterium]
MKKNLQILVILLLYQTALNAQNVFQKWNNCFKDTGMGYSVPTDMITDPNGNTYITGYFDKPGADFDKEHFFLLKLNTDGEQQWINYYPANAETNDKTSFDIGRALVLDKQNNIYVAGDRFDTLCDICTIPIKFWDLFVIKYNPQGGVVWLNRYDGPDDTHQSATEISIDKSGSLLVVGSEGKYNKKTSQTDSKLLIEKINKNGQTAWIRKVKSTVGNAISSDGDGNVLVAGASNNFNVYSLQKPLVTKYSSKGDSLWTAVFDDNNKNGRLFFIGTDASGNIYVNGQTDTAAFVNNPRIITIKYNPAGNLLWARKEIASTNTIPHLYGSFLVDAKGKSYVTGSLAPYHVRRNWITSVYENNGDLSWTAQYADEFEGNDKPADLVTDTAGNVYITGYSYNNKFGYVYTTIKYNAHGIQEWLKTYHNTEHNSNAFSNAIALDGIGNVYVTGSATDGLCTLKYGPKNASLNKDAIEENSILIFPNPVSNILHIKFEKRVTGKLDYKIFNLDGSLFSEGILSAQSPQDAFDINVQNLKKGIHLSKINMGEKMYKVTFIKD